MKDKTVAENKKLSEAKEYLLKVHEIKPDFYMEKINKGLGEIFETEKNYEPALKHYKLYYKVLLIL